MPNKITRCPKCGTSFRISDAHLNSSKGAVRCGSCLNVFRARDHLVTVPAEQPSLGVSKAKMTMTMPALSADTIKSHSSHDTTPPPISETPTDPNQTRLLNDDDGDDDVLISDEGVHTRDTHSTNQRAAEKNTEKPNLSLFEISSKKFEVDDNSEMSTDESWALDLLDSENGDIPSSKSQDESGIDDLFSEADDKEDEDYFDDSTDNRPSSKTTPEPKRSAFAKFSPFVIIDDEGNSRKKSRALKSRDTLDEVSALLTESEDDDKELKASPRSKPDYSEIDYPESSDFEEERHDREDELDELERDSDIDGYDDDDHPDPSYEDGFDDFQDLSASNSWRKNKEEDEDDWDEEWDPLEDDDDEYDAIDETPEPRSRLKSSQSHKRKNKFTAETDEFDAMGSSSNYLEAIEPEPVEFDWHARKSILEGNIKWIGLSALAALILIIQVFWMNMDTWSLKPSYRPLYASMCNILGCTLPSLEDRSKIVASNLTVRTHPAVPGALMVDAVIRNRSTFDQSFPPLNLVFTDLNDKLVAARRFTPDEYLGGELAGKRLMPPRQPIRIALEVVDPGPNAVSYRISIDE